MKKLFQELSTEELTADCVERRVKMVKTVYSQEVNKIMKCRKSEVGTSYLYRPQLVWFDLVR
jgi:hypothetical protein